MTRSDNDEARCGGKTCFESQALARKIARRSSQRHDAPIMAFRCLTCGKWHTGTTNRGDKKRGMRTR